MFYQSAADSELLRVAGPGDVALSKDKQADKNSHSHSLSVSEAPWRRGKEERMINRRSCRASPHLLRSCSNVKHCSMLEWDIDSCLNRSTDSKNTSCARSPWKHQGLHTHSAPKKISLSAQGPQKVKTEIIIQKDLFWAVGNVPTPLLATVRGYNFIWNPANVWMHSTEQAWRWCSNRKMNTALFALVRSLKKTSFEVMWFKQLCWNSSWMSV